MSSDLYIGLMSGTSLDGVDAVLACFDEPDAVLASYFLPFPTDLRDYLTRLLRSGEDEIHRAALASNQLAETYATAARQLLLRTNRQPSQIRAIGCHGQTIRHDPTNRYTIQLGNGALLAESTGIQVVCDFRSRDVAAGGQGAPLVPAFHARLFGRSDVNRVIVNIGGIANITHLPANERVIGFDCGPGNALMDEWISQHQGARYDEDGTWASRGSVIEPMLSALLAEPYFACVPPKSTGRELFNSRWLAQHLHPDYAAVDVQATLCELTAASIANAIERFCPDTAEVFVCGGGAANGDLMRRLRARLSPTKLASTDTLGIHPDWVEAVAFAWLARETLAGRPGNLPAVTGASGLRVLGCIYPA